MNGAGERGMVNLLCPTNRADDVAVGRFLRAPKREAPSDERCQHASAAVNVDPKPR